jgi:hypothetical protein
MEGSQVEQRKGGMITMKRIIGTVLIVFFVLSLNSGVFADEQKTTSKSEPSTAAIIADVIVLRPAGIIGTIIGGAAFLISLPVTVPTKTYKQTGDALFMKPANFTFSRPLGQM